MRQLVILLFLFPFTLFSDVLYPEAELSSPRSTMNYFLKTMKGYKQGDEKGLELAIKSLNLNNFDPETREISGKLAAKRLSMTLDRLEYIDVSTIPQKLEENIWVYRKQIVKLNDNLHPVEISIAKTKDGDWLFTKNTVSSIAYFEQSTTDKKTADGVIKLTDNTTHLKSILPAWASEKYFVLMNWQWMGIFIIIICSLIVEKILRRYVAKITNRILQKAQVQLTDKKQKQFTFPIGVMTYSGLWVASIGFLELDDALLSLLLRAGKVVFTVGSVMMVHHLVDIMAIYFLGFAKKSDNKFDDILVPLIQKALKTFVIIIGIVFIGDSLTLDMKNLLAGLGIGGIAFALAAKDTISNLFGSVTVLLDRPFHIGDWVTIDDKIDGSVETVGLRSTKVRTFYDSLITVPNGTLTSAHIDNHGKRRYRRYSATLGLQYDTPAEKVEAFCEGIRKLIQDHPHTRKDYFHVYFKGFGNFSLDIMLYVFWKVPDWASELNERHRLLLDILRLGKSLNIDFAFPTQTLHLFNESEKNQHEALATDKIHPYATELSQKISREPIVSKTHRSAASELN